MKIRIIFLQLLLPCVMVRVLLKTTVINFQVFSGISVPTAGFLELTSVYTLCSYRQQSVVIDMAQLVCTFVSIHDNLTFLSGSRSKNRIGISTI